MDCEGFAVEQKYLSFLYPDRESEVREREERGVRIEAEVLSELPFEESETFSEEEL